VSTWQAIRLARSEGLLSVALGDSRSQTIAADALRRQAQESAEQGRRRQVQLNVEQGTRLMSDGDLAGSLPYFVEALRLDADDPARVADHRLRLGMLLAQCAKPARIWFHDEPIVATVLRPDGSAVATALRDGSIVVHDLDSGERIGATMRYPSVIEYLDFSPDGRRLVVALVDGTARVWDVATGRDAFPPLKHPSGVKWAIFSPDGSLIFTAGVGDVASRVWDAATGGPVTDWFASDAWNPGCFSRDGRLLAFGRHHGELHIVDARTGLPTGPPIRMGGEFSLSPSDCFSPDGRRIVTGGYTVRVWDTATGRPVAVMQQGVWNWAAFSADGRRVLSSNREGARLWNAATGAPLC
jgi:WD40 repeat protein